jgi:hypothetical protein
MAQKEWSGMLGCMFSHLISSTQAFVYRFALSTEVWIEMFH